MNGSMQLIDFNSKSFKGFEDKEEILLDTGIIFAYLNEYDVWHTTVKKLFENHIFNNDKVMFLFVNPTVINEVEFLSQQPLKFYLQKHPDKSVNQCEIDRVKKLLNMSLIQLIESRILNILDGDKESVLKQIKLSNILGAADAVNATIADAYGINFLTVDRRLANHMYQLQKDLKDIEKIYYTQGKYRDY